jgi:hypothetical protein
MKAAPIARAMMAGMMVGRAMGGLRSAVIEIIVGDAMLFVEVKCSTASPNIWSSHVFPGRGNWVACGATLNDLKKHGMRPLAPRRIFFHSVPTKDAPQLP